MRIIAGGLGGRVFESPRGHRTHPMSDKMRGALFSALGDVEGLTALDAFAGSGALAFEAVSRGAASVIAIDIDKAAHRTITENSATLGIIGKVKAIRANVSGWSDNNPNVTFDIVLCDPPYDQLQLPLITKLTSHVKPDGLLVLSWPGNTEIPELSGNELVQQKGYGDGQLAFYRKVS